MMPDAVPPSACHLIVLGSQREREEKKKRAGEQHPSTQHGLWDIGPIVLRSQLICAEMDSTLKMGCDFHLE